MLDGVMLLWFLLTAAALLFVAIDIRKSCAGRELARACRFTDVHRFEAEVAEISVKLVRSL